MDILQLSLLKNAGCAGGCKFCGLSVASAVNRSVRADGSEFRQAFSSARRADARLEMVFPTVGTNPREVLGLLDTVAGVLTENADVETAINPGICTRADFFAALLERGIGRYRNNLECSRRLFREMVPDRPDAQEAKLRSLSLAREAGMKVDTGWLCGLGESAEDIEDVLDLLRLAAPDSITLNYFDPRESAERFDHTPPSAAVGLERFRTLRQAFPGVELTLGGAYRLWLGERALEITGADGAYVGRFLDHGLKDEIPQTASGCSDDAPPLVQIRAGSARAAHRRSAG